MHHCAHPMSGYAKSRGGLANIGAPGILGRSRRRIIVRRPAPALGTEFDASSRTGSLLGAGGEKDDRQQPQHRLQAAPGRIPTLSIVSKGPPNHREQALAISGSYDK